MGIIADSTCFLYALPYRLPMLPKFVLCVVLRSIAPCVSNFDVSPKSQTSVSFPPTPLWTCFLSQGLNDSLLTADHTHPCGWQALSHGNPKYNGTPHTGGPSLHLSHNPMWFLSFQTSLCFCRVGGGGRKFDVVVCILLPLTFLLPPFFFLYERYFHNHKSIPNVSLGIQRNIC